MTSKSKYKTTRKMQLTSMNPGTDHSYQQPSFNQRDLAPKDWCHCATSTDYCGEGCYQPHNNMNKPQKGGSSC